MRSGGPHRHAYAANGVTTEIYPQYCLNIAAPGRLLILPAVSGRQTQEQTMMTSPLRLVRLGEARRRTQADQDSGMLEEIPVHRFRTLETG